MSALSGPKHGHHLSSYEDYDMIMGQVVGKLKNLESPVWMDLEYDVGDENDDLEYAVGADGVVRAYFLGGRDVKVIQMINVQKPARHTYRLFSTDARDAQFWTSALVAIKFTRLDLMGADIGVDGKIIDASQNKVIGAFHMTVSRGTMYRLMSGLAWTFDAVVAGSAVGLNTVGTVSGATGTAIGGGIGTGIEVVGDGLGAAGSAIGSGIGTGIEVVGDGLGAAGSAIGRAWEPSLEARRIYWAMWPIIWL